MEASPLTDSNIDTAPVVPDLTSLEQTGMGADYRQKVAASLPTVDHSQIDMSKGPVTEDQYRQADSTPQIDLAHPMSQDQYIESLKARGVNPQDIADEIPDLAYKMWGKNPIGPQTVGDVLRYGAIAARAPFYDIPLAAARALKDTGQAGWALVNHIGTIAQANQVPDDPEAQKRADASGRTVVASGLSFLNDSNRMIAGAGNNIIGLAARAGIRSLDDPLTKEQVLTNLRAMKAAEQSQQDIQRANLPDAVKNSYASWFNKNLTPDTQEKMRQMFGSATQKELEDSGYSAADAEKMSMLPFYAIPMGRMVPEFISGPISEALLKATALPFKGIEKVMGSSALQRTMYHGSLYYGLYAASHGNFEPLILGLGLRTSAPYISGMSGSIADFLKEAGTRAGLSPVERQTLAAIEAQTGATPGFLSRGFMNVAGGAAHGMVQMAPLTLSAQSPQEFFQTLGTGAGLGGGFAGAHDLAAATTLAARKAMFDTAVKTPQGTYLPLSTDSLEYGLPELDSLHAKDTDSWSQENIDDLNRQRHLMQGTAKVFTMPSDVFEGKFGPNAHGAFVRNPAGEPFIIYNGEAGFENAKNHEPLHAVRDSLSPADRAQLDKSLLSNNDASAFASQYYSRLAKKPMQVDFDSLPDRADPNDPLGMSKENVMDEMAVDSLKNRDISQITDDPGLKRKIQQGIGKSLESLGIPTTTHEVQSITGVTPSMTSMSILENALRRMAVSAQEAGPTYGTEPIPDIAPATAQPAESAPAAPAGAPLMLTEHATPTAESVQDPAAHFQTVVKGLRALGKSATDAKNLADFSIGEARDLGKTVTPEQLIYHSLSGKWPTTTPRPPEPPAAAAPAPVTPPVKPVAPAAQAAEPAPDHTMQQVVAIQRAMESGEITDPESLQNYLNQNRASFMPKEETMDTSREQGSVYVGDLGGTTKNSIFYDPQSGKTVSIPVNGTGNDLRTALQEVRGERVSYMPISEPETPEFKKWSGGARVVLNSAPEPTAPFDAYRITKNNANDDRYDALPIGESGLTMHGSPGKANMSAEDLHDLIGPEQAGAVMRDLSRGRPYMEAATKPEPPKFKTGEPVVVGAYHGTQSEEPFHTFAPEMMGESTGAPSAREGFFFSARPDTAETYAHDPVSLAYDAQRKMMADAHKNVIWMEINHDIGGYDIVSAPRITEPTEYGTTSRIDGSAKVIVGHTKGVPYNNEDVDAADRKLNPEYYRIKDMSYSQFIKEFPDQIKPNVHEVYLKFQNPMVYDFEGSHYREQSYYNLIKKAKAEGHDGAIFTNTYDYGFQQGTPEPDNIFVVFDNKNIKSTGNIGTFNPENPDIRYMPIARANDMAQDYVEKSGIGQVLPPSGAVVNPDRAKKIALDYEALPKSDNSPETRAAYTKFIQEVDGQYKHAVDSGFKFEFTTNDPYKNSSEMMNDVAQGKLKVYTGGEDHPYMGESTRDENGLTANDKFRAVHDLYGHASEGNQFGPNGEERAWRKHAAMFSPEALPAMTAETRGQNSWVNYGPHMWNDEGWKGDKGNSEYIAPQDRPFAEQKAALLPEEHTRAILPEEFSKTLSAAMGTQPSGGLNPNTGQSNPGEAGVEVLPEARATYKNKPTPRTLLSYYNNNKELFDKYPELSIGWDHTDKGWELNIGATGSKLGAASVGSMLDQRAAWDIAKGEEIPTGGKGEQTQFPNYPIEDRMRDLKGEMFQHLTPEEVDHVFNIRNGIERLSSAFNSIDFNKSLEAAKGGASQKQWYDNAAKEIEDIFGPDSDRFAALLAAMSANTPVHPNLENALHVWEAWENAGRPGDGKGDAITPEERQQIRDLIVEGMSNAKQSLKQRGVTGLAGMSGAGPKTLSPNVTRALSAPDASPSELRLSGPKVSSFHSNLTNNLERLREVTNDRHMSKLFYGHSEAFASGRTVREGLLTKSPEYLAASATTRKVADTLSQVTGEQWTPKQAQAAMWSWQKATEGRAQFGGQDIESTPGFAERLKEYKQSIHEPF